jgi:hypothetical protein
VGDMKSIMTSGVLLANLLLYFSSEELAGYYEMLITTFKLWTRKPETKPSNLIPI